ncbi:MAG: hypothetical protein AAB871_04035 [Patescibacteria group bacterium]
MDIYGGLLLESLLKKDRYFALQAELFDKDVISGVQLRVAHPFFTPGLGSAALPYIPKLLPSGMKLFIHVGAENVGVDFGQNLDECGVFGRSNMATGVSWSVWNRRTLDWAQGVALAAGLTAPWGVAHPGYGVSSVDWPTRESVIKILKRLPAGSVALENVPPVADRDLYNLLTNTKADWPRKQYWGFGGTPEDMDKLLLEAGDGNLCLIDFTHLQVMVNQANARFWPELDAWQDLEYVVEQYLDLQHCKICHFSGVPPAEVLMDSHDHFSAPLPVPIRDGLNRMDVVCLEIPFREFDETRRQVEDFREQLERR